MTRLLAAAHSAPRILAALAALAVAPMAQAVSTASRYVQDGLLACWDGIENAGAGQHDDGAAVWKDIVHGYEFTLNGVIIGDDRMTFAGTKTSYGTLNAADTTSIFEAARDGTLEIVYVSPDESNQVLLQSSAASGLSFGFWKNAAVGWHLCTYTGSGSGPTFDLAPGTAVTNSVSVRYTSGVPVSARASGEDLLRKTTDYWGSPNDTTIIGTRTSKANNHFHGAIYCIRVYSRQLTDAEIDANRALDVQRFVEGDVYAADDMLFVSTSPAVAGSPSPSGTTTGLAAGQTVSVSCGATPWTNAAETVRYDCTGWKLYDADGNVVSNGTETSFTYTHPDPADYRMLEWQWVPSVGPVRSEPVISGILLNREPAADSSVTATCGVSARGDGASSITLDLDWGEDPTFAVCETTRLLDGSVDAPPLERTTTIGSLVAGTRYYVRARAANDLGVVGTNTVDFLMRPRVTVNPDGTRTCAPVSFEDVGNFAEVVFFPGDSIEFPNEPEKGYCTADENAAVLLDGSVIHCREPGVNLVNAYAITPTGTGMATNLVGTIPIVVAPRSADCPAGVWLYLKDANFNWTDPTAWVHVSGPDGDGYPDGEGVCALVYPSLSANRTVTLPASGVTVGFLGLGDAKGVASNGKITMAGGSITYSAPGTNAWLRFAGKSVRTKSNIIFAASVTNRFESSTDLDFMGQVGPNTTWTTMEIPEGVVVRTVRGKYESNHTGGFTFDGALLGEGTLQFTAVCYNTFNAAVKTFRGTVDLVRGTRGSDHDAAGINFRFGELAQARELIVHGTAGQDGNCAFFESGRGNTAGPVQKVGAFPEHVTLTGGRLNLGAPGNGSAPGDYRYAITNLHLRGPMGKIDCANLTRYGTMYGVTTTVFNVDVSFGPTAYLACVDPVKFRLPTSPEGAVAVDGSRELLPYFIAHENNVDGTYTRPLYGERIYRDRETGFCYHAVPGTDYLPAVNGPWPGDLTGDVRVHLNNGNRTFTMGSDVDLDALMFTRSGWGTATVKFSEPDVRVGISSGCLSLHTGTMFGPLSDANSSSAVIDFGRRAYVHTIVASTIGAKLSGVQGLVQTGNGNLILAGDSSETLSGGVAVNCGTLTLGQAGYPADLGANDVAIYAGATLEIVELASQKCRQATVEFVDEPLFGAYGGITLPEGTTMCYKMRVNGVAQTRGTYGATGSGAQFIDDDHFAGPGILRVRSDDHQGFIILFR